MIRPLPGLILVLAQAGTPAEKPPPLVAPATIRIGLSSTDARVLVLSAADGLRVLDAGNRRPVWRERFDGDVRVVRIGGAEPRLVYSVQVGSFADEARARELARTLGPRVGAEARVHFDPDRHVWRVRLGAFPERGAAAPLIEALAEAGQPQAWVASEALPAGGGDAALRLVDRDFEERRLGAHRLLVLPAGDGLVTVNGRRYRGAVEVYLDRVGRLRAVNELPLEEYLRGVVPEEMGPKIYNEIEALKAQAVAARTYAVRNLGQFAEDGFDLCDTPRCQVYGGADSEQPLTDAAIAATRGEVLVFEGRPINALFSSTCGGHTEDVRNVFGEQDEPYLRGVPCMPEEGATAQAAGALEGRPLLAPLARSPRVARAAARLRAAGVLDDGDLEELLAGGGAPPGSGAWRAMLRRLAPRLGRAAPPPGDERGRLTRGAAADDLVALLNWEDRLATLLRPADSPLLAGAAGGAAPTAAIALLVREGILDPAPSIAEEAAAAPLPASTAALALGRLLDRYASDLFEEVRVAGAEGTRLRTRTAGDLELAADAALFLFVAGGDPVPVARLPVSRNDPLVVHRDRKGRLDYVEALRPFRGAGDDRTSNLSWWEVRLTRGEAEARLSRTLGFGTLVDLQVIARGVSGRVAALDVLGTRRTIRLEGFGVRSALDLNDTLFTIERERDEDGRVRAFVFAGRGWGHGVGLCQIGGYGMALRGRDHAEILSRYYPGATLLRLAAAPSPPGKAGRRRS